MFFGFFGPRVKDIETKRGKERPNQKTKVKGERERRGTQKNRRIILFFPSDSFFLYGCHGDDGRTGRCLGNTFPVVTQCQGSEPKKQETQINNINKTLNSSAVARLNGLLLKQIYLACCSQCYKNTHTHTHTPFHPSISLFLPADEIFRSSPFSLKLLISFALIFSPTLSCWGTALILCGVGCFLSNARVFVCVRSQEWKRGEANGLAYSAQRQLPRERRPQGKSLEGAPAKPHKQKLSNKLITGIFCMTAPQESHQGYKTIKLVLKGFLFFFFISTRKVKQTLLLAAVGLSCIK